MCSLLTPVWTVVLLVPFDRLVVSPWNMLLLFGLLKLEAMMASVQACVLLFDPFSSLVVYLFSRWPWCVLVPKCRLVLRVNPVLQECL